MSGNYPDGTGPSDPRAPWNQDEPASHSYTDDNLLEIFENERLDFGGVVAYEASRGDDSPDDAWWVELPDYDEHAGPFDTREDAVAYVLFEGGEAIAEAADEALRLAEEDEAAYGGTAYD